MIDKLALEMKGLMLSNLDKAVKIAETIKTKKRREKFCNWYKQIAHMDF